MAKDPFAPSAGYECRFCLAWNPSYIPNCPMCRQRGCMRPLDAVSSASPVADEDDGTPERRIGKLEFKNLPRFKTWSPGLNRVLGGGFIKGGFYLLGGEPGAGKTTLLMQTLGRLDVPAAVYATGEQQSDAISRLGHRLNVLHKEHLWIVTTGCLEDIIAVCERRRARIVVIDSVQRVFSRHPQWAKAQAGQGHLVKYVIDHLIEKLKTNGVTVVLVGQMNKDGAFEGVNALPHMVDGVYRMVNNSDDPSDKLKHIRMVKDRESDGGTATVRIVKDSGMVHVPNKEDLDAEADRADAAAVTAVTLPAASTAAHVPAVAPSLPVPGTPPEPARRRARAPTGVAAAPAPIDATAALVSLVTALIPRLQLQLDPAPQPRTRQRAVESMPTKPPAPPEPEEEPDLARSGLALVPKPPRVSPRPPRSLKEAALMLAERERSALDEAIPEAAVHDS